MAYLKVNKIELVDGSISYTAIGYINTSDEASFKGFHPTHITTWIVDNSELPLEDFFNTNSFCYGLDTINSIDGLSLITDLENPEG